MKEFERRMNIEAVGKKLYRKVPKEDRPTVEQFGDLIRTFYKLERIEKQE